MSDSEADLEVQEIMGHASPSRQNREAQTPPNSAPRDNAGEQQQFMMKVKEQLKKIKGKTSAKDVVNRLAERFGGLKFDTKHGQGTSTNMRMEKCKQTSAKRRKRKIQANRGLPGLPKKLGQPKIW